MPGMFNGKATEYTEYTNTMEPYLGALIQEEKEVKSPRSPVTEAKDIDDDEVDEPRSNLLERGQHSTVTLSCLIATTTGEVGTLVQCCKHSHSVAGAEQMVPTMVEIIAPSRAKSIGELQ